MIRPFLKDMTKSELHAVCTGGFATIAGAVMAAYILMKVRTFIILSFKPNQILLYPKIVLFCFVCSLSQWLCSLKLNKAEFLHTCSSYLIGCVVGVRRKHFVSEKTFCLFLFSEENVLFC